MGERYKYLLRTGVFLLIGFIIFMGIQCILEPKYLPYDKMYDAGKFRGYCAEENNSIDVLISGTSHAARILPMELYKNYGIRSYDLATSLQSIEVTYYVLAEALKTQKPKVFVFDVSSLYFEDSANVYWEYVISDMPFGKNRIALAREFCKKDGEKSFLEILIPLFGYHTRWKELQKNDFKYIFYNKHHYGKGAMIFSTYLDGGVSSDDMNMSVEQLLQNRSRLEYIYDNGEVKNIQEDDNIYNLQIPESNVEWLCKIKNLCDEYDIQLLAIKVPVVQWPWVSRSAWSLYKYQEIRDLCKEYGISYCDFMYDFDLGMDWTTDSSDGGYHLNWCGAYKVSDCLGRYLSDQYNLVSVNDEQWDHDLVSYQKVRKVVELELEREFMSYINNLIDGCSDKVIFIVAADDMATGLSDEDVDILRELGLQTDFSTTIQNSYLAVIDNGKVVYEASGNRPLEYTGTISGKEYKMYSSGWYTYAQASMKLEDKEYAYNGRRINIIVYDDERNLVLDSVCFDTCLSEHTVIRDNYLINRLEEEFERYIIEIEDR